ncbi:MAG: dihydroorotase [Flavobacteriales bacterium]|nr:dihydroorotase [Flavobacteriales bacterium]
MQILLRATKIIDPNSKHNGKVLDILIKDGKIESIGNNLDATGVDEVIEGDDLHVSTGWVDMYATFGDPGREYKEDIESGLNAAAQGGFTKVAISPEAEPAIDDKSAIRYILKKAEGHVVDALPLGAITKGLAGVEMAEMFDMQDSGAVAVSNGKHTIENTKLQNLAYLYGKNLNMAMYSFCEDEQMAAGGQMHEGEMNTTLGLKGIPALAEEIKVARDIYLAEYSDVAVHFSHITTKGSVELIRQAKAKGLKVTSSVPAHHLLLTDESISEFDPNFKVSPPFRNQEHINALKEGLADGTIDAIISDHEPQEIEAKFSEFGIAEPGITALETAFSAAIESLSDKLSLEQIIQKFTSNPRKILNLNQPKIEEGEEAELTVFAPTIVWTYTKEDVKSRSYNSPLLDRELTGLPVAVINKDQLYVNH